jgi:hypothetical protein
LLDVLQYRPVDRFEYFESFLGLGAVDAAVKELTDTRSAWQKQITQTRQKLENEFRALESLVPAPSQPLKSVKAFEAVVCDVAQRLGIAQAGSPFSACKIQIEQTITASASGKLERRRSELTVASDRSSNFSRSFAKRHPRSLGDINAAFNKALRGAVEGESLELLEHALVHFETRIGERCPVCNQILDWRKTLDALRNRNDALKELRRLELERLQIRTAWRAVLKELSVNIEDCRPLVDLTELDSYTSAHQPLDQLMLHQDMTDSDFDLAAADGDALIAHVTHLASSLQRHLTASSATLPKADELPALQLASSLASRLAERGPQLKLLESQLSTALREANLLEIVYNAMRKARQDVAKATLSEIQDIVTRYYTALHPPDNDDEVTGAPSIAVQRHGKGSAFVRGEFCGKSVPDPRWVYSDGHLDTVGICIFLALRRHRASQPDDPKLLVLDDIVLSIDLGHARRLIDLLHDEFADHQLFIFTHNGLFAAWCHGMMAGIRRVQIIGWSPDTGPRLRDYVLAYDKLRNSMGSGTAKDIALHLMELMDEWTAEARLAYSLPVGARYGEQYHLADIWNPFAKRMRDLGKRLKSDLGGAVQLLAHLRDLPRIRNMKAAHENEFAKEFPRKVMVEIATAVLALVDALYCKDCRSFVVPVPNPDAPSMAHCRQHHIQYVKEPPQDGDS